MSIERRVVDNRVFLLGLDQLYRFSIAGHESGELLACARRVAKDANVTPGNEPIEGYYAIDPKLTEYFRLVRALQNTREDAAASTGPSADLNRLREVLASPLYGCPHYGGNLLPKGRDSLTQALDTVGEWTVPVLVATANRIAQETGDFSLVGLAVRAQDPVVITALRESVVLYAMEGVLGSLPRVEYAWKVDGVIAEAAMNFIEAFNRLFDERLPAAVPRSAWAYWDAYEGCDILGRCVRIGRDDSKSPEEHYHWAICRDDAGNVVQDFWRPDVWTTERYRSMLGPEGHCPTL